MIINCGEKHKGRSVEMVIIKDPQYVKWVLETTNVSGPLLSVREEMIRLLNVFDGKVLTKKCQGLDCNNVATGASVYKDNPNPMWWCNECDPYEHGALPGRLQIIETYVDALNHVRNYCKGRKSDYRDLIRSIAMAKGLGKRVGQEQAQEFFR